MKPILFNTEMVKAILEGRKTVTRRVIKGQDKNTMYAGRCALGVGLFDNNTSERVIEPPYRVGDILYVRETFFQAVSHYLDVSGECVSVLSPIFEYLADGQHTKGHWYNDRQDYYMVKRPSIHMPKEAARLFLRVTGVRLERLQDMKFKDYEAEGISNPCDSCTDFPFEKCDTCGRDATMALSFIALWDDTVKKDQREYYGWKANPYVWVIEFEDISEDIKNGRV